MKTLWLVLILLLTPLAGSAFAEDPDPAGPRPKAQGDAHLGDMPEPGAIGREGGEDINSAVPIGSLPFTDTGYTCDNIHNYGESCPYGADMAPDVVYSYSPGADAGITIDLCASDFDSKVYVYRDTVTIGAPYACNDDAGCGYSGWQAMIEYMLVEAGHTYYIVIDGTFGPDECGNYVLRVLDCELDCPAGSMPEGEPPLHDNYVDLWNSGCDRPPTYLPRFQVLEAQDEGGCLTFCGRSGTFIFHGLQRHDTDWFEVTSVGNLIEWTLDSEHVVFGSETTTGDCNNVSVIQSMTAGTCNQAIMSIDTTPGQLHWLRVAPLAWWGVPEFDYVMTICGISGAVPTERSSWGHVKELYR